jgi:hypothetical protein
MRLSHQVEATCPLFLAGLITRVFLSFNLSIGATNVDYSTNFVQWSTSTGFISMEQTLSPVSAPFEASFLTCRTRFLGAIGTARLRAMAGQLHIF